MAMIRRRRLRRRLKSLYDEAVKAIRETVILSSLPESEEIDIQKYYEISTRALGKYVTLDWEHKRDIDNLITNIKAYSRDQTRTRPLNIIMIAGPGLGKSHFIKCLSKKMGHIGLGEVSFNMATLQNIDDLVHPIEAVRNLKVVDQLPLLFLDEIDRNNSIYSLLLPLLWDGELSIGRRDLKLGKVIIIMAASDPNIKKVMKSAKSMQMELDSVSNDQKKLVDLLSRVNGGVIEMPDLDLSTQSRDRRVDKVCLSIALLQGRFGPYLARVPWALLKFIAINRFRYGVRSIAHIMEFIAGDSDFEDTISLKDLKLPLNSERELKRSSLAYHLIAEEDPENIVESWNEISQCQTLVRFAPEEEDEYL